MDLSTGGALAIRSRLRLDSAWTRASRIWTDSHRGRERCLLREGRRPDRRKGQDASPGSTPRRAAGQSRADCRQRAVKHGRCRRWRGRRQGLRHWPTQTRRPSQRSSLAGGCRRRRLRASHSRATSRGACRAAASLLVCRRAHMGVRWCHGDRIQTDVWSMLGFILGRTRCRGRPLAGWPRLRALVPLDDNPLRRANRCAQGLRKACLRDD